MTDSKCITGERCILRSPGSLLGKLADGRATKNEKSEGSRVGDKEDKSMLPVKSLKHMVPGRHPGDSSVERAI